MPRPALILAASLAVAPAQAQTSLLATSLPDIQTFQSPAAGFSPLTASPEALAAHGFPPRPSPANHAAYAFWHHAMVAWRTTIVPTLQRTHLAAGPARHGATVWRAAGTSTSPNWSATVLANNVTAFGRGAFNGVAGTFNIPPANQPNARCTGGFVRLFTWAGLDGWYNNEVFQAGTESNASCVDGVITTQYYAWVEWFPTLESRITNFPVTAGDAMLVWMIPSTTTTGTAFLLNITTGQSASLQLNAPPGTILTGNSAEWVQERPYWYGVLSTLDNYGGAWFSAEAASIIGSTTIYTYANPGTAAPLLVTMLDDTGKPISYPTQIGPNATYFQNLGSSR